MIADWGIEPVGEKSYPFSSMLGPEDLPGLTAELLRRGFSEPDMRKIYHGNYFRVMSEVLR